MSRTVLITGTRKGIGRGLAEHFLARGDRVVGCSREDSDLSHEAYRHVSCDLTEEAEVVALVRSVRDREGRLDAVINNAGTAMMNHLLLTPGSAVESILRLNVWAPFCVIREAAKLMQRRKTGRIVNLSSIAAPLALEGEAAYAASKAALENLTRTAARELAPLGITVNAVGPGPVETDLIRPLPKAKKDALLARQTIPRLGTIGEVAHAVAFFLEEDSSFLTGQTLYLGGTYA